MTRSLAPTALMLGNVVTGTAVMSPTAMLADLARGLDVTVTQAGLLVTFGAVVLCLGSPLMIWWTSRIDRRLLLAASMLGVALCHVALALAPGYAAVLAVRLVMLALVVVFTPVAAGTVAMIVPEAKRPGAIVYVFLGWPLALAFGLPLVSYAAAHVGWRETFAAIGVLALLAGLLVAAQVPRGLHGETMNLRTWAALGRNRAVLLLLLVTVLQVSGQFAVFTFLGPLLLRLVGASPQLIAIGFALFGVCGFLGNVATMRLVGALGPFRMSLVLMTGLLIGSVLWVAGAATAAVPLLLASVLFWGLAFAALNSMQQTRLIAAAPAYGSASVALNTSMLYVGQAVGSGLGGLYFARDQIQGNGYVALGFILLALGVLWITRPAQVAAAH
jgi:predicted MFS family arabinose efflux permease